MADKQEEKLENETAIYIPDRKKIHQPFYLGVRKHGHRVLLVPCPFCDNVFTVREDSFNSGATKSCGCLRRKKAKQTGLDNKGENIIQRSIQGYDRVFYCSERDKAKYYICDSNEVTEAHCFSRHIRKGSVSISDPVRVEKGKMLYASRVIMNTPEGMDCDHLNGQTEDLRKVNLRNCTDLQNKANTPNGVGRVKRVKGGKYTVVFPDGVDYDASSLLFNSKEEAKEKLRQLQEEIFGEYAYVHSQKTASEIETYEFKKDKWVDSWAESGTMKAIMDLSPDSDLNARVRDMKVLSKSKTITPDQEWTMQHELMYDYNQFKKKAKN